MFDFACKEKSEKVTGNFRDSQIRNCLVHLLLFITDNFFYHSKKSFNICDVFYCLTSNFDIRHREVSILKFLSSFMSGHNNNIRCWTFSESQVKLTHPKPLMITICVIMLNFDAVQMLFKYVAGSHIKVSFVRSSRKYCMSVVEVGQ